MALEGEHENKNMATRRVATNTYREGNVFRIYNLSLSKLSIRLYVSNLGVI